MDAPSAKRHLQPLQFQHRMPTENYHHIDAMHGGQKVGYLRWAAKKTKFGPAGEIVALRTHPDFRRQGVATGMFNEGQKYDAPPSHSSKRTPEGSKFAKSTGKKVPRLTKALPSEDSLGLSHETLRQMD